MFLVHCAVLLLVINPDSLHIRTSTLILLYSYEFLERNCDRRELQWCLVKALEFLISYSKFSVPHSTPLYHLHFLRCIERTLRQCCSRTIIFLSRMCYSQDYRPCRIEPWDRIRRMFAGQLKHLGLRTTHSLVHLTDTVDSVISSHRSLFPSTILAKQMFIANQIGAS